MALVDAVVVSYNSRNHLRRCVEPLAGADWVNVVVVDNASSDGSLETLDGLDLKTVAGRENVGFARGSNAGARLGAAPYVLFLNPDAVIAEQALQRLVDALETDASIGLAGPRIVSEERELVFSQRRNTRLRSTYSQALFLHRLFPRASWTDEVVRDPRAYERPGEPEWLSGACMLVRRSLMEQLGGFDERFFLYCEDMDLCVRVGQAGFRVVYVPAAEVTHVGGASAPAATTIPLLAASRSRFAHKHLGPARALGERLGIALGEVTHGLAGRGTPAVRRAHRRAAANALRRKA